MTTISTYQQKHKDYYANNKKSATIAVSKNKYKLTQRGAERVYEINQLLKPIRNNVKNFHLDDNYCRLMLEKAKIIYKEIIL